MAVARAADSSDNPQQLAADRGTPIVSASRASYLDDADTVRPDNMQATQLLVEHLVRHGHQRIAWLGGQSSSLTRAERVGGYCATLLKYSLPFHSDWVLERSSSQKQVAEEVTALLRRNPTISAVMCYNEVIAVGVWFDLMRAGCQSGKIGADRHFEQQISLVGLTDVAESTPDDIPIIWACTPARKMGYTFAERTPQRIGHDDGHSRNLTLLVRLVVTR